MDGTRKFATALSLAGGATKAKIRKLKGRRWKYPLSLELQYATAINRYMTKRWKEYAAQALAMMVPRMDAVSLEPAPGEYGPALGAIVSIARNSGEFNKREMDAFRKIAVGDAFVQDEPWVEKTLQDWAQNQVSLITKATDDMRDAVARRVRDGVKHGKINREIESQIMQDLPGISKRRAQIIARDQASKLNASLSEGRMKDAGLETYIWETAYDERVRGLPGGKYPKALPSHWAMQGKICRWDDPTVYRNAKGEWEKRPANCPYTTPGTEILCRCVALPNWDELEEVEAAGPEVKAQREIERAQEAIEKAATAAGYINPSNPALAAFVQEEARAKTALENLLAAVTGAAKKPAAVVAVRLTQTAHPDREGLDTEEFLIKHYGFSKNDAADIHRSLIDYTGKYYTEIRHAQRGAFSSRGADFVKRMEDSGKSLETFIVNAPYWAGGTTFRGFVTSKERFEKLMADVANGAIIDMRGLSSWSTNANIAKAFATDGARGGNYSVILKCEGQNRGTSIKAVSKFKDEDEVLVSKDARYKIKSIEQKDNVYVLNVEEVSDGW